jgi:hypothetical protein
MLQDTINIPALRRSVRRLFSNDVRAVIAELLQNSQRARGTEVVITTNLDTGTVRYSDDGHGLADAQAFFTMLALGASYFNNPTLADQDPMGLGLHALLAHEAVRSVTFASGQRRVTMDADRWWDDTTYYEGIFAAIRDDATYHETHAPLRGLSIEIEADRGFVEAVQRAFETRPYYRVGTFTKDYYPISAGYAGYMNIMLNGIWQPTELPMAIDARVLFGFTYQSCDVEVRYSPHEDWNVVVWYGQAIHIKNDSHLSWRIYVNAGRPLNPQAPIRNSIIDDQAYRAFLDTVHDQLYAYTIQLEQIDPALLLSIMRSIQCENELPFFLARRLDDRDDRHLYAFRYDQSPALLSRTVSVIVGSDQDYAEDGIETFEADIVRLLQTPLDQVYQLYRGNADRVATHYLSWKPGPEAPPYLNEHGVCAIHDDYGASGAIPEEAWSAVSSDNVIAVFYGCSYDPRDAHWIGAARDLPTFFTQTIDLAFDSEGSDDSYDTCKEQFDEAAYAMLLASVGECVEADWRYGDVQHMVRGTISAIRLIYDEKHEPTALEVDTSEGTTQLAIYR